MKARIFCERQLETGDEFEGGIKYFYNELSECVCVCACVCVCVCIVCVAK